MNENIVTCSCEAIASCFLFVFLFKKKLYWSKSAYFCCHPNMLSCLQMPGRQNSFGQQNYRQKCFDVGFLLVFGHPSWNVLSESAFSSICSTTKGNLRGSQSPEYSLWKLSEINVKHHFTGTSQIFLSFEIREAVPDPPTPPCMISVGDFSSSMTYFACQTHVHLFRSPMLHLQTANSWLWQRRLTLRLHCSHFRSLWTRIWETNNCSAHIWHTQLQRSCTAEIIHQTLHHFESSFKYFAFTRYIHLW